MNKPIKIIHLISSLARGGRERQLSIIVSKTNLDEYDSKIIYFNKTVYSYIEEYDLWRHIIKISKKDFILRFIELYRIINDFKPKIIFSWGNLEAVYSMLLNTFIPFKHVNMSVRHGIRSKKFSHYFRTLILHLSKYVVANSYAGLKANNLKGGYLLYNGIEDKFIKKKIINKIEKRKLLMPDVLNKILIISVANLVPYKDYSSILEALALLKDDGISFYYIILGDGPLRNEIEITVDEYNLSKYVRILGHVNNVDEYLSVSDIFLHSSKGEGCSNAILEAMAAGLPVIASDTGGTKEIVSEKNGLLFKYQDVTGLYKNIKFMIENKKIIEKMSIESQKIIKNRFTIPIMMKRYEDIIEKVMNNE